MENLRHLLLREIITHNAMFHGGFRLILIYKTFKRKKLALIKSIPPIDRVQHLPPQP